MADLMEINRREWRVTCVDTFGREREAVIIAIRDPECPRVVFSAPPGEQAVLSLTATTEVMDALELAREWAHVPAYAGEAV